MTRAAGAGMRLVPGGTFLMGSDAHYPEERPARRVTVQAFAIDATPVTNAQFRRFVRDTGYVTTAERTPNQEDYPGVPASALVAGSAVFRAPSGPVPLDRPDAWWSYAEGANWRRPGGHGHVAPDTHPVVHVTLEDALAYAAWAGKFLPTEAQWEYAARGGLDGATFAWGNEERPGGRVMANTWDGDFPWRHARPDGPGTTPVRRYPPNGFGLYDMIGNVWEWTLDALNRDEACCPPCEAGGGTRHVVKGGSHLCAPTYCFRYRPAARQPLHADTSTSHVGFRCVRPP